MNRFPAHRARTRIRAVAATVAAAALLVLTLPGEAESQSPRYGAGWTAGVSHVSELNAGAAAELLPGYGYVVGVHIDRWYGASRRFGLRYQGSFQQPRFDWATGSRRIHAPSADLSAMVRLLLPEDGGPAHPYLAGGVGGVWYDLGTGPTTVYSPADAMHDGGSRIVPTGVLAAGVDIPVPLVWHRYPVGIRIEVADHIAIHSPLRSISDGSRHDPVHHLRFTIGLHSSFSY